MIFPSRRPKGRRIGGVDKVETGWWLVVSRGIRNPFDRRRHGKHGRRIESLEAACETHKGGRGSIRTYIA